MARQQSPPRAGGLALALFGPPVPGHQAVRVPLPAIGLSSKQFQFGSAAGGAASKTGAVVLSLCPQRAREDWMQSAG